ncbi:MAG: DUF4252 domain-containing protein, partial [Cyclobacteriaceae bacterium]|nr:DUF4252 domain-containing protein [Cyclobacteriaceae bacterium]
WENDRTFTVVTISGKMFSLFTDIETSDPEDQAILDAISKLSGLRLITKDNISNGFDLYKRALDKIPSDDYVELMTVREEDSDIKFLIREKGAVISELVMVMGSDHEFLVLSLYGIIDLDQISKLSKKVDIDGLEELDKLKEKDKEKEKSKN